MLPSCSSLLTVLEAFDISFIKMFKPVSGADLSQFDEKTKALYRMRESDPRLTEALLRLPRTSRNYVPVVAHEGNAYV